MPSTKRQIIQATKFEIAICDLKLEVPFWHLKLEVTICDFKFEASVKWSPQRVSNPRHPDYKSGALPTELCVHDLKRGIVSIPPHRGNRSRRRVVARHRQWRWGRRWVRPGRTSRFLCLDILRA